MSIYVIYKLQYRGADKSLARPDWKNNWKVANFSSYAETRLDGQRSDFFFFGGLQKSGFGRCSWNSKGPAR